MKIRKRKKTLVLVAKPVSKKMTERCYHVHCFLKYFWLCLLAGIKKCPICKVKDAKFT